ncbi:MAG: M14 metallopeptidase family protein [Gemmatimonadaceae bacterium]|nr:M14 metallopeptidase family protein [Gemmatimonadaceae bacterium]
MTSGRSITGVLRLLCPALLLTAPMTRVTAQGPVPTPSDVLGIPVGADRTLADYPQVLRYFATLAQRSPSVKLDTIGMTTMGKPMIVAAISTPENIRRLDAILANQRRLSDPRTLSAAAEDSLVATQPTVVFISANLHSSEIASSQMAMELAHSLITTDSLQRSLRNVVIALVPSMNPDGMQLIVDWYKTGLGTPFEGGAMPWLYHQYVGHDNNRDWYMVTQKESRAVSTALYTKYFPQVYYDVHQQGSNGMRLTVPPHIDPINQNVDVRIVRGINLVGQRMSWALQQAGKTGVGDGITYDLWWNGGGRSTPTRHNMIGLLTEAASVRIATPITLKPEEITANRGALRNEPRVNYPSPWQGGVWRLRDIMDYELIAAQALVTMAGEMRGDIVRSMVQVARTQLELGRGKQYVIDAKQHDPAAAYGLVQVLRRGGIEVTGDDDAVRANGGSWTVSLEQPYAAHVRDLFEEQKWPASAGDRPYDVAGWTLPYQMGVTVRLETGAAKTVATTGAASSCAPTGGNVTLDLRDSRAFPATFAALKRGVRVDMRRARDAATVTMPGSFARSFTPDGGWCGSATSAAAAGASTRLSKAPRVALYKPWTASMDEGWTRWLFDTEGVPYANVTDSVMKGGNLRAAFDVLIIPDLSLREAKEGLAARAAPAQYAGGLGADGVKAIGDFVAAGGVLMTFDKGSELALDAVPGLPVRRIAPAPRGRGGEETEGATGGSGVVAPGSILRTISARGHRLTMGMPDTVPVYFTNSTAFDVAPDANVEVPLRYPGDAASLLMSGYLSGGQALAGKAAAVDITVGAGRVVMFGFRPQYRGQSWGTFKLLYNAILTSGERSKPTTALVP